MVDVSNDILAVRAFNRFYTRLVGALDEQLLGSGFSLPEARLIYELAARGQTTAAALAADLALDPGYLSRLVRTLADRDLVARTPSPSDGRETVLALTEAGRAAFAPLEQKSNDAIGALLAPLTDAARRNVIAATETITRAFAPGATIAPRATILRRHQPGDIGWVTHRQGKLYAEEYGWDETYEALVAEILSAFVKNFDARRERAWIAEVDGAIAGSVFLVRQSDEIAKLRLLYVEPEARGFGLGKRLVEECIAFARGSGYRTLTLWTNDVLSAARHIYEKAGFRLVSQGRHKSFGKDLVGQTWELAL
jgi:DNA-binding MarR family transcriptional regulator/GNAT superfamily N-acetyltransferase